MVVEQRLNSLNSISELSKEEAELAQLQVVMLQEELEVAIQKAKELMRSEQALKVAKDKIKRLEHRLEIANEEVKLSNSKSEQAQREIKAISTRCEKLNATMAQKLQEAELKGQTKFEAIDNERKKLAKQLSQLQRNVEDAEYENASLRKSFEQIRKSKEESAKFCLEKDKKLQSKELELELASLQISQLQEELEYYYLALQESERSLNKRLKRNTMDEKTILTKAFDKALVSTLSVTGQYSEGDYHDIHLSLHNVVFPNGTHLEKLNVKLFIESENIGIEFRHNDNEVLFREIEGASDEFGPYIRYYATVPESLEEQQQDVLNWLNASERLFLMCSINAIAELLQNNNIDTATDIPSDNWRIWRNAAIQFSHHVDNSPSWLSFDRVNLIEEFVSDGYEHLWLAFDSMLSGNIWRNSFEFKLSASGVGVAQNGEFSDSINIEFREQEDGSAPLMSWPPQNADDFGPKLMVPIDNHKSLSELTEQDKQLIEHLVLNLPSILEKLDVSSLELAHVKADWVSAIIALTTNQNSKQLTEQSSVMSSEIDIEFVCNEVISMGNYQHIVFTQEDENIKIKLRAENVDADSFDADVYLEYRDGTENVKYCDSEFFEHDDFGPSVKLPVEILLESSNSDRFEEAVNFFKIIPEIIQASDEVDELIKMMWLNIIQQKQHSYK